MADITSTSKLFLALPWYGYSMVVVEPPAGYAANDTVDVGDYIKTIKAAWSVGSGAISPVTWSGTIVTITTAGHSAVIVLGR